MKRVIFILAAALVLCSCASGSGDDSISADDSSVVETSAFSAAEPVLYTGTGYTIEISGEWKISDIVQDGIDCTLQPAYPHNSEEAATLLAFQTVEGSVSGTTSEMGEMLADNYEQLDGWTIVESGLCTVGDNEAYSVVVSNEILKMRHTIISQGGNLYSIMLTASEGQFDSARTEADKITDSFKITRKDEE